MRNSKAILSGNFGDAEELFSVIDALISEGRKHYKHCVINVYDKDGATLSVARLEEETLSDGSKAYNIVLAESAFPSKYIR